MPLLTPRSLQYCLAISIASRILIVALQLISSFILEDHDADAYRNKYHKSLANDKQMLALLPSGYSLSYQCLQGFTKWDAQYFLEISMDGYVTEQHLAFLPFYPIVISTLRQALFGHTRLSFEHFLPIARKVPLTTHQNVSVNALEAYIQSMLVGVTINNFIFFPAACILLFTLTKLVKGNDEKYARSAIWWFCFNPASIFFSSCYSESLFAAIALMAMFSIEYRSQKYLSAHPSYSNKQNQTIFVPLHHLNRLIYIVMPALVPLALASATRSNGLVNIGFIIFHFLIKYATLFMSRNELRSLLAYVSLILEIVQDVLVLVMSSVLAAAGYISFQIHSFIRFCVDDFNDPSKGSLQPRPLWCDHLLPHAYGQVQAKYWNVGLFRYYQLKQLPNFLLAAPISFIVLYGSLEGTRTLSKLAFKPTRSLVAYYIQAISLTLLCSVSINIQVITRLLLSSCPAIYWICADIATADRRKSRLLITYFISYLTFGTILHVNFYPWT